MPVACTTCGNMNPDESSFCQYCGAALTSQPAPPPDAGAGRPSAPAGVNVEPAPQSPASPWPAADPLRGAQAYHPQQGYGGQYAMQPYAPPAVVLGAGLKDPSTGLLLELIPGFFGFIGIGWLWAGEVGLGVGLLLGYWAVWATAMVLTVLSFGVLGLCLIPMLIVLYFVAPIASALTLQKRLKERQALVVSAQPF